MNRIIKTGFYVCKAFRQAVEEGWLKIISTTGEKGPNKVSPSLKGIIQSGAGVAGMHLLQFQRVGQLPCMKIDGVRSTTITGTWAGLLRAWSGQSDRFVSVLTLWSPDNHIYGYMSIDFLFFIE